MWLCPFPTLVYTPNISERVPTLVYTLNIYERVPTLVYWPNNCACSNVIYWPIICACTNVWTGQVSVHVPKLFTGQIVRVPTWSTGPITVRVPTLSAGQISVPIQTYQLAKYLCVFQGYLLAKELCVFQRYLLAKYMCVFKHINWPNIFGPINNVGTCTYYVRVPTLFTGQITVRVPTLFTGQIHFQYMCVLRFLWNLQSPPSRQYLTCDFYVFFFQLLFWTISTDFALILILFAPTQNTFSTSTFVLISASPSLFSTGNMSNTSVHTLRRRKSSQPTPWRRERHKGTQTGTGQVLDGSSTGLSTASTPAERAQANQGVPKLAKPIPSSLPDIPARQLGKALSRMASRQSGVRDQASLLRKQQTARPHSVHWWLSHQRPVKVGFTVRQDGTTLHEDSAAYTVSAFSLTTITR